MLVTSEICIKSTEIIGGKSKGFFATNGRVKMLIAIKPKWKVDDRAILLYIYLSLFGSEISATFVNPEPESNPITSRTLP